MKQDSENQKKIKISVTIPFFRAKYIGWLAFEGLIRQEEVNFSWEIIIAEEDFDECMGKKAIMKYASRLHEVGCVRIRYFALKKWLPLADKRRFLIRRCDPNSKIIINCSADFYQPPKRLATVYKIFEENPKVDWVPLLTHILYDIRTDTLAMRPINQKKFRKDIASPAISASLWKAAAPMVKKRRHGVDGMLWRAIREVVKSRKRKINIIWDDTDNWKYAINTNGFNTLSIGHRDGKFKRGADHYYHVLKEDDLGEHIPDIIAEKLKNSKKLLVNHNRKLPGKSVQHKVKKKKKKKRKL